MSLCLKFSQIKQMGWFPPQDKLIFALSLQWWERRKSHRIPRRTWWVCEMASAAGFCFRRLTHTCAAECGPCFLWDIGPLVSPLQNRGKESVCSGWRTYDWRCLFCQPTQVCRIWTNTLQLEITHPRDKKKEWKEREKGWEMSLDGTQRAVSG